MAYTTIDDPSVYFQAKIYSGNGGSQAITNDGNADLQPDWAWFKKRSGSESHALFDTSRGIDRFVISDTNAVEQHQPTTGNTDADDIASFNSDGFTFQGGGGGINQSSNTYVAWQWKANGGTTASNTDGNLTTTIQANQDAGFSIVLWTSTGSSDTIGHGLGATPSIIMEKSRSQTGDFTFFTNKGGNKLLFLNNTNTVTTSFSGVSNVGSSIFTDGNGGTDTRLAYCFTEKQGYSKFGFYEGNNNANGPFVYLGFKPAFVMIKNIDAAKVWFMWDNARDTFNQANHTFEANASSAEGNDGTGAENHIDMLSNGFKIRNVGSHLNPDSETVFFMAFAESPFVSSEGVPTTAK